MKRREFVQAAVSACATPGLLLGQNANPAPPLPAPVPWTTGLNAATPIPKVQVADALAHPEAHFFTTAQMATLQRLSDILVPALNGRPGAIAAQVPEFLDFLIGHSPNDRKAFYQGGLNWLDDEAKRRFSASFGKLNEQQAGRILQPLMRTWLSDHPPTEAHADFVNMAHADIRAATVNSKLWSEAAVTIGQESTPKGLYFFPIDPDIYALTPRLPGSVSRASRSPL